MRRWGDGCVGGREGVWVGGGDDFMNDEGGRYGYAYG